MVTRPQGAGLDHHSMITSTPALNWAQIPDHHFLPVFQAYRLLRIQQAAVFHRQISNSQNLVLEHSFTFHQQASPPQDSPFHEKWMEVFTTIFNTIHPGLFRTHSLIWDVFIFWGKYSFHADVDITASLLLTSAFPTLTIIISPSFRPSLFYEWQNKSLIPSVPCCVVLQCQSLAYLIVQSL